MKTALAVFCGDKVNRNGERMTAGALLGALEQSWEFGLPSLLGHDVHLPIGWARGLSLYFEPGETRSTGITFFSEGANDHEEIVRRHRALLAKRNAEDTKPFEAEIQKHFGPYLSAGTRRLHAEAVCVWEKQIAVKKLPALFAQRDKDGLIPLKALEPVAAGVYRSGGVLVFAHPFLRRNLSRLNSLNVPFLDQLHKASQNSELECRIALDEDMLGLDGTYAARIEWAYAWGPKFSDDLTGIKIGVTVHEADDDQRSMAGISRTELGWYLQDGNKVFESEEIRERPTLGVSSSSFGCRYVHSILDPSFSVPIHLDGAIRAYDEAQMIQRLDQNIRRAGRHATYTKLWRVDGKLPVILWKELITHYYRDNMLVGEYLGGHDQIIVDSQVRRRARQAPQTIQRRTVPYDMKKGAGVRIALSFDQKDDSQTISRTIEPMDSFADENGRNRAVEYSVLELIKALRRKGEEIVCPGGVSLVSFQDHISNLPHVKHHGANSVQHADVTLSAIKDLCLAFGKQDRLMSFSVGVDYDTKSANFSFGGHIADILAWLELGEARLPRNEHELAKWAEVTAENLYKSFPEAHDQPPLEILQMRSGLIRFERVLLKQEEFTFKIDELGHSVDIELKVPQSDRELMGLLQSEELTASAFFELRHSSCSKCKADYSTCGCSKLMDKNVIQIIEDCRPLGAFWTNRPARLRVKPK